MTTDKEWRTAQQNINAPFRKKVTEGRYRSLQNQQWRKEGGFQSKN